MACLCFVIFLKASAWIMLFISLPSRRAERELSRACSLSYFRRPVHGLCCVSFCLHAVLRERELSRESSIVIMSLVGI
ncbi:hypothetical protein KP509_30G040300 [Ceratopteris richardii]|uniref:Secreted protein n=1 Tax=Ceratopteris richardii TaxID=49495 RepID=A0A8T2R3I1_CERRI|nr:hypothetical protein KP509_30G040300 [Ceratopteris richardii]